MNREQFYKPVERGFERDVQKRLEYWARLRARRRQVASGASGASEASGRDAADGEDR